MMPPIYNIEEFLAVSGRVSKRTRVKYDQKKREAGLGPSPTLVTDLVPVMAGFTKVSDGALTKTRVLQDKKRVLDEAIHKEPDAKPLSIRRVTRVFANLNLLAEAPDVRACGSGAGSEAVKPSSAPCV